ncbi:hypothetical protein [Zavarzinella formosa]|uniref:hypothetical protein n=1 Tax=Zavarzinella formosa TaxID=360055 RepID=UPI00036A2477|nr:hypothetical protein [Zavarzinella formosa]
MKANPDLGRFMPPRVVLAWAILGAFVAICPLYSYWVFFASSGTVPASPPDIKLQQGTGGGIRYGGRPDTCPYRHEEHSSLDVHLFGTDVIDNHQPGRRAFLLARIWNCSVYGGLIVLGGLAGGMIGRYLPARVRPSRPSDRWRQVATTAAATGLIIGLGVPGDEDPQFRNSFLKMIEAPDLWDLIYFCYETLRVAALALPLGWAAQVAATTSSFRRSLPRPDQSADYDDATQP